MIDNALILAAGFGKRLRPLTNKVPKCLVQVKREPLLNRTLKNVAAVANNLHINTHYKAEQISDYIKSHHNQLNIQILHEEQKLGGGGTVKRLYHSKSIDKLLIYNADIYLYGSPFLKQFVSSYSGTGHHLCIIDKARLKFEEQGDFDIDATTNALKFNKGGQYVYTGIAIVDAAAVASYAEGIYSITDALKHQKNMSYFKVPDHSSWLDIGTLEKLEYAQNV